jgi:hypothetical protein
MLENFDKYQIHPTQRAKTVLMIADALAAHVRRRPVEVLRGIDQHGDWMFGLELRQINQLTLAKLRAMHADGTNVAVTAVTMSSWPASVEVRHTAQLDGSAVVTIAFEPNHELELPVVGNKLTELRTYYPDGVEMLAPWVSLALTA